MPRSKTTVPPPLPPPSLYEEFVTADPQFGHLLVGVIGRPQPPHVGAWSDTSFEQSGHLISGMYPFNIRSGQLIAWPRPREGTQCRRATSLDKNETTPAIVMALQAWQSFGGGSHGLSSRSWLQKANPRGSALTDVRAWPP